MKKPHFLCIGAQKAGTSWLWVTLKQHPEIWMPPFKELHFFDHLYVEENRNWTHHHLNKGIQDSLKWHVNKGMIDLPYFKYLIDIALVNPFTEDWYLSCFDRKNANGKVLGDVTPEYSTIPVKGIEYVKQLLGKDLKIIYMIREPMDRAISQVKMNITRKGNEDKGLDFWMEEAKRPEIKQRGDYKSYIENWESVFGNENILYVPFRMIQTEASDVVQSIEDFLGVSHFNDYTTLNTKIHETKKVEIPKKTKTYLKRTTKSQRDYLSKKFDSDFISNI